MKSIILSDRVRQRKWLLVPAISLIGLAIAGGLWTRGTAAESTAAQNAQAMPVSAAVVQAAEVLTWDEFSGRLEAVERVELRPRVAGTVQAVHFREGGLVKQGDLLISIDPAPYAAEVERAEAQLAAAQARAQQAQTELARAQRLLAEQAIAQREFDERSHGQQEAAANVRAAQASLQSARLNLGYTKIRAPISGRIGKLEVTTGNQVAAGPSAPVLTTLMSVNPVYVSFDADEQVMAKFHSERNKLERIPVQMGTMSMEGTPILGHLQLIDNQINAKSGTVRVRAVFDNKGGSLTPGQFARVRMGAANKIQALLINERAIGSDQSKRFVMVVDGNNKAEYREVQLGTTVDGMRIVTGGLKADERIVVNGLQRVRPGVLLAPTLVPMDTRPELQNNASSTAAKKS